MGDPRCLCINVQCFTLSPVSARLSHYLHIPGIVATNKCQESILNKCYRGNLRAGGAVGGIGTMSVPIKHHARNVDKTTTYKLPSLIK